MLVDSLKILLASTYAFVIKAQNFHWNVESENFPQYHAFLGDLYAEVYDSIDKCAEYIRTLDAYAPGSLQRFAELSIIQDQIKIPRARLMFAELLADNQKLLELIAAAFAEAEEENKQGIANFLAERDDSHSAWNWKIRSILKKDRA